MAVQIQMRRGTAAQWTSADPTLALGEFAIETDTNKIKLGTGTTPWTTLGYFIPGQDLDDLLDVVITDPTTNQILQFNGTNWVNADIDALPDQTGSNGYFLTTDGTTASWAQVDALPSQTGNEGKYLTTDGTSASWAAVASGEAISSFLLMGA